MKRQPNKSASDSSLRCSYVFPSGRRCRLLAPNVVGEGTPTAVGQEPGTDPPFCPRHRPKEDPAAELVRGLSDFHSVAEVTVFLSRLIFALSKDQISTRRASVLSYVAVSLMHGFRSMQQEFVVERGEKNFELLPWTWKMPRPGSKGFANIDDARALYAQQYADDMREKAEKSLAAAGLTSHYYPYRSDLQPKEPKEEPAEETPLTPEEAIRNFNRLRT